MGVARSFSFKGVPSQANYDIIMSIIANMKEIPELPSEAPKDISSMDHVDFREEGGVFTHMEHHAYPYPGFPLGQCVEEVDHMKKMLRAFLSGLFHEFRSIPIMKYVLLLPAALVSRLFVRAGLQIAYKRFERIRIKRNWCSRAVRAVHHAFSVELPGETEYAYDLRIRLRDAICMILEFDNAYRFRFQNVMVELDQKALRKDPIHELTRLFVILQSRENRVEVSDTWELFKFAIAGYLRFDRQLTRMIVNAFEHLSLESIAMNEGDIYFCALRTDYQFQEIHTRKDIITRATQDQKYREGRTELSKESTRDLQALAEQFTKELRMMAPERTNEEKKQILDAIQATMKKLGEDYQERMKSTEQSEMTVEQLSRYQQHQEKLKAREQHWDVQHRGLWERYQQEIGASPVLA